MSGYQHKPPANLPELQRQWAEEAQSLQQALADAQGAAETLRRDAIRGKSTAAQDAAALAELKAAQAYNAFLDKDREYNREGDAEDRALTTRRNLSPLERHQLETTRDQKWATAGEFQHWKTAQGLKPAPVTAINTDTDTHFPDGHTERRGTPQGMAASAWDAAKQGASAFVDAVKQGPSNEVNAALCEGLIGLGLRRMVPKLPAGTDHALGKYAWGKALSEAKGATDPAGDTCRLIYPASRSLEDLKKYGAVNVIQDPQLGKLHVVDVDRKLLDGLLPKGLENLEAQLGARAVAQNQPAALEPTTAQQTQIDQFKHALGTKLKEHGMSPAQIHTLASAAVAHHRTEPLGSADGASWYGLSNDGTSIAMRYPPGVLTEMNVAQALEKTPSEHIAQANQAEATQKTQASEAQVVAMNSAQTEQAKSAQR